MAKKIELRNVVNLETGLLYGDHIVNVLMGIKYIQEMEEIIITEEKTDMNYLLFFLQGESVVNCNQYSNYVFHKNEMVLLPKSSFVHITVTPKSEILVISFNIPMDGTEKHIFQSLSNICESILPNLYSLPIRYPLFLFLETLICCSKKQINTQQLYDIMQSEFFFLLSSFYKKEELAKLFYPILGAKITFRDFVIQNHAHVKTLEELIELSNIGRSTFFKEFKKEFGVTAKYWMMQQLKGRILGKLSDPDVSVKELMCISHFDSESQFFRFVKQEFSCTPKQLIDQYHSNI